MDTPKPSNSDPDFSILPPQKRYKYKYSYPDNSLIPPRKRLTSFTLELDYHTTDKTEKTTEPTVRKKDQFAIPKEVKDGSASRTITAWKKLHEINLLKSILEYHNKNGVYPFDDSTHMEKFYESWIENEAYIDDDVFNNKMVELPERFYKNQVKLGTFGANMKAWMPPVEIEIYELSDMIWGNKDDDFDDDFDDVTPVVDDDDDVDDGGSCIDPNNDDDQN